MITYARHPRHLHVATPSEISSAPHLTPDFSWALARVPPAKPKILHPRDGLHECAERV